MRSDPNRVGCYFVTGTGRSGSMLLSKVLSSAANTHCNHEHSVQTLVMKDAYARGDYTELNEGAGRTIDELVAAYAKEGRSYGECSSHLFLLLPELYRRYGRSARFVLVVRRPDTWVGSALARGFFDPSHPKPCEHVRPAAATEVGSQWTALTAFDRCMWYWNLVNATVLETFRALPPEIVRVVRMEDLDLAEVERLFDFLGLEGFASRRDEIQSLLGTRVNASPGEGDERSLNPWSQRIAMHDAGDWNAAERESFRRWAAPLARALYPEWMDATFGARS